MTSTTENNHDELREKVTAEMAAGSLTQTAVAREAGIQSARFNQWLNGRYAGDNDAVAADVARWLTARAERARSVGLIPAAPEWVDTETAKKVREALLWAQAAGDLVVIYGVPGVGKTLACKQYAAAHPNTWCFAATKGKSALVSCFEELASAMGIKLDTGHVPRIEAAILERLQGAGGLIIVDEAQFLVKGALEGLRSLHDATGVGLALVGSDQLYTSMTGGARSLAYAQLFSRVGRWVKLSRVRARDVDAIADAWQIEDQALRRELRTAAAKPGALRVVTKALRFATLLANGDGKSLDVGYFERAWLTFGGAA